MEEPIEPIKSKNTLLRRLVKLIGWTGVLFTAIVAAMLSLLLIYEDEVKAAIIKELNKHLRSEVKIKPENIQLTILSTFPDCSIEFKDVLMLEAMQKKKCDTLLYAQQLNLHFNLLDIWNKKYNINKIALKKGNINVYITKSGKNNYTFWQENEGGHQNNDSLRFDLKEIKIENVELRYADKQKELMLDLNLDRLKFSGNFKSAEFDLNTSSSVYIRKLESSKTTYLADKTCELDFSLEVKNEAYRIKRADIVINQMALNLDGSFRYINGLRDLALTYKAPKLDIAAVISLLPEQFKQRMNDYESDGSLYANGQIRYKDENNYVVNSDFGIKQGSLLYKPKATRATQVNLQGKLRLSQSESRLELNDVNFQLKEDKIVGDLVIQNFSRPEIRFVTQASVHFNHLQSFWPIDTVQQISGLLHLKAAGEGLVEDLVSPNFSKKVKLELNAEVKDLLVQLKQDTKTYALESCILSTKQGEVEFHDMRIKRGESDLKLAGKLPGFFNFLFSKNQALVMTGTLYSNHVRFEDFLPETSMGSSTNEEPLIPKNIDLKLNAAILNFNYAKFKATSITGDIEIKHQKAIANNVKLQAMDGNADISLFADNSENRLELVIQSKLSEINVSQLFSQFNNFSQTTLTDKQIKGFATAEIDFSGIWNNKLEADYKSIKTMANISIDKGELIDFKPLLSLSKFVDVKELQHIKFSNLQGKAEIKNELIYLPKTSVKNSAINIELAGTHSFNNDIDYHIQLLLSDLISKKRKNNAEEFGPIENDPENRRSAFISMTGTVDNPIIKFDRKGLREKVKSDVKQEKQTIKQLLKEEFGLFKRDSGIKNAPIKEQAFELEKTTNKKPKTLEQKREQEEDDDF